MKKRYADEMARDITRRSAPKYRMNTQVSVLYETSYSIRLSWYAIWYAQI